MAFTAILLQSHRSLRQAIGSTVARWPVTVVLMGLSLTIRRPPNEGMRQPAKDPD